MNTDELVASYRALNASFSKTMVYHIGIDAGFFTEYTYMIHAMLYCLQHRIQFKLYADDANFGWDRGWEDCFEPFCELVHEGFHRTYNTHRIPSWRALLSDPKLPKMKLLKWKLKVMAKNGMGRMMAWRAYGQPTLLNCHVRFCPHQHFCIPELGIDGDYLHAFQKMTAITWRLNESMAQACSRMAASLQLPPRYAGCQIRGGDKITETSLLPPACYVRLLQQYTALRDVFVLTDDYRLFEQLPELAEGMHWYTLCSAEERGYVNQDFTQTAKERKKKQMTRFLCSIQLLMNASAFVGSITTGPSLFLLKNFYPEIHLTDCSLEDFPAASVLPIPERGRVAAAYLQTH